MTEQTRIRWEMTPEQLRVLAESIGYASMVRVELTEDQQSVFTAQWIKHQQREG